MKYISSALLYTSTIYYIPIRHTSNLDRIQKLQINFIVKFLKMCFLYIIRLNAKRLITYSNMCKANTSGRHDSRRKNCYYGTPIKNDQLIVDRRLKAIVSRLERIPFPLSRVFLMSRFGFLGLPSSPRKKKSIFYSLKPKSFLEV